MNTRSTSVLAVVSLIAGLLGWTAMPLIGSIVAIITGHMARREIREHPELDGDALAIISLILGYGVVGLALFLVVLLSLLYGALTLPA